MNTLPPFVEVNMFLLRIAVACSLQHALDSELDKKINPNKKEAGQFDSKRPHLSGTNFSNTKALLKFMLKGS